MAGCFEPNLKLRQAERLFEDQLVGPESIANIGGQFKQPLLPVYEFTLGLEVTRIRIVAVK